MNWNWNWNEQLLRKSFTGTGIVLSEINSKHTLHAVSSESLAAGLQKQGGISPDHVSSEDRTEKRTRHAACNVMCKLLHC